MNSNLDTLIGLEKQFWQSMVDEQTDVALKLLTEPSFMVSPHGAMKFDHATYKKMAEQGSMVIKRYELGEMDATFVRDDTAILSYKVKQVLSPRGNSEETEQDMFDTSTWVKVGDAWRCAMHTETPVKAN
ncbi:nuclear transport factor 2 family protein [Hydrogenophaga sp.]|uniref:nuclear transport factor 2 family protein n=1 Tax=Hydrogenophaga sp. TaxID=1904254 RepID=UPI00271EF13A|nr:nuclear transport factor 2 family protein [Hydrogenophaga sp.]MDO9437693.1 nuclear transport factor 2 family protein [Hydrogenophaga sp.]